MEGSGMKRREYGIEYGFGSQWEEDKWWQPMRKKVAVVAKEFFRGFFRG